MKKLLLFLALPLSAEFTTRVTTRPTLVINQEFDLVVGHKSDLFCGYNYKIINEKLSYDLFYNLSLCNDMNYIIGTKVNWSPATYCKIMPGIAYNSQSKMTNIGVEIQLECKF